MVAKRRRKQSDVNWLVLSVVRTQAWGDKEIRMRRRRERTIWGERERKEGKGFEEERGNTAKKRGTREGGGKDAKERRGANPGLWRDTAA
jgi:hypothetical protein